MRRLDLFGSAATGAFDPETSDLDFADALEALFGRPVDRLTENMIGTPYFRQAVEATRQPVYDDQDAQVAV